MDKTFKQYCSDFLNNSKYGNKYKNNNQLWENKKRDLLSVWKNEVLEMKTPAKEIVIRSFVEEFGINSINALFRGNKEIIIESWLKTQVNKINKNSLV